MKEKNKEYKKPIMTDEARRFKQIRKDEKLTQVEMAEVLGLTQSAIHKYEGGDNFIPTKIWKKIHDKLFYNYEYLINGSGRKKLIDNKRENTLTNVQEINQKYEILSQKFEELNLKMNKIYRDFYSKD